MQLESVFTRLGELHVRRHEYDFGDHSGILKMYRLFQVDDRFPLFVEGNASETIRDLRAANSELYVQLRQWKERHKRLSEACDIFEKNSANAVVMWEALRAIQSQCAGHSDEFSQNVWQLATKALTTADKPAAPIEPADDPDLLTFLEQAGAGCISGRVADWPQLKPACKWAAEEIKRLREAVRPAATGEGEIGETDTVAEQLQMKIGRLEGELETYRRASTYWWMHYCKASGREPHTTVAADAEYIREFDAIRDALWVCMKHNELHHGENHNTVIQAASALNGWQPSAPPSPPAEEQCCLCGSPMNAGSCTGDPDGCVMVVTDKPAEVPQAVITGPGKYVNDGNRFELVLSGVVGKRLTYRRLCAIGDAGFMGIE